MDFVKQLGFVNRPDTAHYIDPALVEYANLKLAALGQPTVEEMSEFTWFKLGESLLASYREANRHLKDYYCPADQHIQDFLIGMFEDLPEFEGVRWVPEPTLVLDRHGLARTLSLPPDRDEFRSDILSSYRVEQGVCHNPLHDRRTTAGVFHVAEGGLPVPWDKKAVPREVFGRILQHALRPPKALMNLPFTDSKDEKAAVFLSLLLRPVVCPEVPGVIEEKASEVRFFAPGGMACNLDFVESIFGNAGDPFLLTNDARLDVDHWSGHSGCVILAPHVIELTKKELGLPRKEDATERQLRDNMYWEDPGEKYNDGGAFKVTCRDASGVMVTVIADNYFGYCKKEVKTQISYAANLYGICEEEHAGGAVAFPSFDLGEDFKLSDYFPRVDHTFAEVKERYGDLMDIQPEGYGMDKTYPDILYVPEDVRINLADQSVAWGPEEDPGKLPLRAEVTYVLPSGYKVEMNRPATGFRFRLTGTRAEGIFCHKPCTVSGGGKSEISKAVTDAMVAGPVIVYDFEEALDEVEKLIQKDYQDRYQEPLDPDKPSRSFLSIDRSLGSVVKLLTPNPEYTEEYNEWVQSIPRHIRDLALVVKRFYKPHWGENWRERFSVDQINGMPGYELKYKKEKIVTRYLRVGFDANGSWRMFSLRQDFAPAEKIQTEDDISATVVVPSDQAPVGTPDFEAPARKYVTNCEYRLFQRPDEAIVRGYDKTAEKDFARSGNFFSNYQPLPRSEAARKIENAIRLDLYTTPMKEFIRRVASTEGPDYFVANPHPRLVDGKPSKNPRYLQNRPDLEAPRETYLARLGARLHRRLQLDDAVTFNVHSVLVGRRNNPPAEGIRALAVYNPIHYQDLPEAFMDFIASLTGKSPSTTGAGSEGALTKAPFNAVPAIVDLNNALVAYILTGLDVFSSAAGYIGPKYRVDHDVSLLVPEIWCRMFVQERKAEALIQEGALEPLEDFTHEGEKILASRLGYRITERFCASYIGRVCSDPVSVFNEEMLKPETQDLAVFADGVKNIVENQKIAAENYFHDGTVESACPPLKALLHIMVHGEYEGKTIRDPEIRNLFTFDSLMESDWYKDRLTMRGRVETDLWTRHHQNLEARLNAPAFMSESERDLLEQRLASVKEHLARLAEVEPEEAYRLTLGTDPAFYS